MVAVVDEPMDVKQDVEFDRAFELLLKLVDLRQADEMLPLGPAAIYTTSVVLWLLVFQRLNKNTTLSEAVLYLIESAEEWCADNKRIREQALSTSTAAYSAGRKRLTVEVAEWFSNEVNRSIIATAPPTLGDRRVFVVDGTTITLAPEKALQTAFPPASNQYGVGVWPVALLVAAHELETGCATQPAIGAMYGPNAISETELAVECFARLPAKSIIMADNAFGIFPVAYEANQHEHSFLFRLTASRFRSLCKKATLKSEGANWKTWELAWTPTAKNRKTTPSLPEDAVVHVQIHEVVVHEKLTLWLVTDLSESAISAAALYQRRGNIETDISNIKVVLDTENIRARSVDMFTKELLTSMVSYNLMVQFRKQAAALAKVPPKKLSFTRVWDTFRIFLMGMKSTDPVAWRNKYQHALNCAMKGKLPNRPGRSYEREVYPKRPKSNQFKKREKPR